MNNNAKKKSSRHSSPIHGYPSSPQQSQRGKQPSFPLPAYLDFVPGGLDYGISFSSSVASGGATASTSTSYNGSKYNSNSNSHWYLLSQLAPEPLVQKTLVADDTLRKYAIRYQHHLSGEPRLDPSTLSANLPHYRLPSLSALAEAAFAPLTGIHSSQVKRWADAMVLAYYLLPDSNSRQESNSVEEILSQSEQDLLQEFSSKQEEIVLRSAKASGVTLQSGMKSTVPQDLVRVLESMRQKTTEEMSSTSSSSSLKMCLPVRPCGYVFRTGDIAWNCKTCQHDNTCVLCDECFQKSDHTGHEVTFHKTSPGGCCDCGDLEAWKAEGCCPLHRPRVTSPLQDRVVRKNDDSKMMEGGVTLDDDGDDTLEALRSMIKGRKDGEAFVREMLPEKFAAALGVVIGAAVQAIVQAVDGAGIGSDPVQWTRRWADQLRKIHDGNSVDEEYVLSNEKSCVATVGQAMKLPCPSRFRLHLRLHNDDVHTFDEVIDALWSGNGSISRIMRMQDGTLDENDTSIGLVSQRKIATEKTQLVDSEGQVLVRDYTTIEGAQAGFDRLKSFGLHCSVLSTPQIELENRARALLSWLTEIASAHPAVSALVVHALVDVTEGDDVFGGVLVWNNARMIPSWSFSDSYLSSARVSIQEDKDEYDVSVPGWRRRMNVFPPHLPSSYLTREEQRQLHKLGFAAVHDFSSPSKGMYVMFVCVFFECYRLSLFF
jgi:hypothetical protein